MDIHSWILDPDLHLPLDSVVPRMAARCASVIITPACSILVRDFFIESWNKGLIQAYMGSS